MQQTSGQGRIRRILTDEDPALRLVSQPVNVADGQLAGDITDMAATLQDFRDRVGFGRAISAPQIGIRKRLIVMNLGGGPIALLNPVITSRSERTQQVWDDCLSVPDKLVLVERSVQVSVRFTTAGGNTEHWDDVSAALSELLEHEIDHLDGILMTDRMIGDEVRALSDR